MSASDPRVAIYTRGLLPTSQTFIRSQALALTRWKPVLLGRYRTERGLDLSGLKFEVIPEAGGRAGRMVRFGPQWPEPRMLRRLKELDVQLVHAHFGTDATDIWPTVKAARLPMLVTLHGYDINTHRSWWESGRGGVFRRWYPRRLLTLAQDPSIRFVAVSHAIARSASEIGIPSDRIDVAYIGVDTELFRPAAMNFDARPNRVLFVGRMVEKKAPLLMIQVFAEVVKRIPDAELVMIGDGELMNDAIRLATDLGCPATFLGAQPAERIRDHLHQSRLLCLPSVTARNGDAEGFGLVILEAQACGVPVVTSATGGAAEGLIPGVTGIATQEGIVDSLVNGILHFLENPKAAHSASIRAAKFVREEFDLRTCTQKLEELYQTHVNRRA